MRIALIGAGYVGLVSSACIAEFGHHLGCADNDLTKVGALRRGETPIFERAWRSSYAQISKLARFLSQQR